MFYIAGITLAFFLGLILFTKQDISRGDRLLGGWLLVIGSHLASYYISKQVTVYYYPYLLLTYPFPLLHGPFLYLYTAALTHQQPVFKSKRFLHFMPFVVFYLLMLPFFMKTHAERLIVFEMKGQGYGWLLLLHKIMVFASGTLYVILSLNLLKKHRQMLSANFSEVEKINLNWLRYLVYEMALIWLAVFYGDDRLIFSLVAVFVIFLGYYGVKQVGVFTQKSESGAVKEARGPVVTLDQSLRSVVEDKTKYIKSALTPQALASIHQQLLELIAAKKVYLNPELTLGELAGQIGVHPNHLSQVINSVEGKTFYDFINGKRIEAFKKRALLPESQKYTIIALAYECGFNSKTAFYRNFKNLTGQSPTDYLRQHQLSMPAE
ncbi:MAG: helix-turn-helix domain-containing protein [Sediminibacterium sp.]|nr:helix-turn-helix domain-containing protein [Sediminibacterium sp.]